jgi:hypothetical protein
MAAKKTVKKKKTTKAKSGKTAKKSVAVKDLGARKSKSMKPAMAVVRRRLI